MLPDGLLECDAMEEVLGGSDTETLLERVEMLTSNPVLAGTRQKRLKEQSKPPEDTPKRQKTLATCLDSICLWNGLYANMRQHLSHQNLTGSQKILS